MNLKLLQIRLPSDAHLELRKLALVRGTSTAELVRQAIDRAHPEIHAGVSLAPGVNASGARPHEDKP
ncbi:ribbon-helix-helix protein, CopG family [Tahibacter harae]|uniref:Ribbon-helix-helix protein, CopG family n=1 Tax=Tahibacter harae TaxID=2963937 RepID=A0ABT1QQX1_9GAMM|nr:ribbon-helix-helix protein, CopG family [Tahibacter harae]MCQ4164701.1 ribbon-helix-helix protein, CopG family [Tahibacter harae]